MSVHFDEFESVSKSDWSLKIKTDLNAKVIGDISLQIADDFEFSPAWHRDDFEITPSPILSLEKDNTWKIVETFEATNFEETNKQILESLTGGTGCLRIIFNANLSKEEFDLLFKDVVWEYITVVCLCNGTSEPSEIISYIIEANKNNLAIINGSIGGDNINPNIATVLHTKFRSKLPGFNFIRLESDLMYAYKETAVYELADLFLGFIQIIDIAKALGTSIDEICRTTEFSIRVGDSYLLNIAKLRAVKLIWNNIVAAYGSDADITIETEISCGSANQDEHANKIKYTSQTLACVCAGVDRIYVPPSDLFSGSASKQNKRISRNMQLIMQMESYMDKTKDPAAGSYYLEKLTEEIGRRVWNYIQDNI